MWSVECVGTSTMNDSGKGRIEIIYAWNNKERFSKWITTDFIWIGRQRAMTTIITGSLETFNHSEWTSFPRSFQSKLNVLHDIFLFTLSFVILWLESEILILSIFIWRWLKNKFRWGLGTPTFIVRTSTNTIGTEMFEMLRNDVHFMI